MPLCKLLFYNSPTWFAYLLVAVFFWPTLCFLHLGKWTYFRIAKSWSLHDEFYKEVKKIYSWLHHLYHIPCPLSLYSSPLASMDCALSYGFPMTSQSTCTLKLQLSHYRYTVLYSTVLYFIVQFRWQYCTSAQVSEYKWLGEYWKTLKLKSSLLPASLSAWPKHEDCCAYGRKYLQD